MSETVERDQETLELFVEESLEALTRVEQMLLDAERGTPRADMMSWLFRDIHTIKGTSGFLALPRILSLAHAAEDLLSEMREGNIKPRRDHYALLMQVSDLLRRMIESARDTNDEGDVEVGPVVEKLRELLALGDELPPAPRVPSARPEPPSVAATRPASDRPGQSKRPSARASRSSRPATSTGPRLGEILVERNVIDERQLERALETQELRKPMLGEVLVEQDAASAAEIEEALAEQRRKDKDANAERGDGTVRVSVGVLDRLMNLIGELVLARNQIVQLLKSNKDASSTAHGACQRLGLVTSDLQEQVMKTRMQPVSRVFERLPRMVRDLAMQTGKQVTCRIEGNATEIDKALVEAIRDPVMHMVRNAVDHGIETAAVRAQSGKSPTGTLRIRAAHEGGMVSIEITDDGRGMDPRKLRAKAVEKGLLSAAEAERLTDREALGLIFRPGFSTAEAVTDISGRGVGMDVVRTHVERAGGQVELESKVGVGTTIRLRMPLTLAIIPALLVQSGEQRFAIPQVNLLELLRLDEETARTAIEHVRGAPIYRLRGEVLPIVHLREVLRLGAPLPSTASDGVTIVVVGVGAQRYGLVVDAIHDTEEIVIKPLHGQLKRLACYSGATVLGDGGLALILEVAGIAAMSGIDATERRRESPSEQAASATKAAQPYVVFIAGQNTQCAVPLAMVARLEQIPRDRIERVGSMEVLQYRGGIMPVVRPESLLPVGEAQLAEGSTEQPLIVFELGERVGMAVSRIVDVVDIATDAENGGSASVAYTTGKHVVFGRTTLLLDAFAIVRELVPTFAGAKRESRGNGRRVLVVEDSLALRAALATHLRAKGIAVVEAGDGVAALAAIRSQDDVSFDAVITDLEMNGMDGWELLAALRREHPELPLFVWTMHEGPAIERRAREAGAKACLHKLRRDELTAALFGAGGGHEGRPS